MVIKVPFVILGMRKHAIFRFLVHDVYLMLYVLNGLSNQHWIGNTTKRKVGKVQWSLLL